MRNLAPLRLNYSYFLKIISMKHLGVRTALQGIAPSIQTEYRKYVKACNGNNLHSFTASNFTGVDVVNLKDCYADRVEVNNLKQHIYDNQPSHIRYECQYCMIGDSGDSFDHYLPKEDFPEFSVLSNNLIPCCTRCNTHKSIYWNDAGLSRSIINIYYDQIPVQQFLNCAITYRRDTPIINFSISNPGGINPNLFRVITRHFERLFLLDRFKLKSNTEITNVINSLTPLLGSYTLLQASTYLLDDVVQMKLSYGNNYWKALLKEALANSNRFLAQIGFV